MKTDFTASLQRRMLFAGDSRLYWDRAASHPLAIRCLKTFADNHRPAQRIPDKLSVLSYDLWECIRSQAIVPCFGEPRGATLLANQRILQHPNYRIYWNDTDRNVEIGVQIGIDFIRHKGRYFALELNFDASMKHDRRMLYPAEKADPILSGIASRASQAGYRRLMLFHRIWNSQQKQEILNATGALGLEATVVNLPNGDSTQIALTALPKQLPDGTFCVVFHSQHQPIDFFLGDKSATSLWLQQQQNHKNKLIGTVQSSSELFVPPLDESGYWPNLVIKLGGIDLGKSVAFAKVRDEGEAMHTLGMTNRHDKPRIFGGSFLSQLEARLFHRDHIVYQQFIPPELTESGHASKIRSHYVFTPLRDFFLSAHFVVSNSELPKEIPFGRVSNGNAFVINRNQGGYYARVDAQTEQDLEQIAVELGQALRAAASSRFVVSPDEEAADHQDAERSV